MAAAAAPAAAAAAPSPKVDDDVDDPLLLSAARWQAIPRAAVCARGAAKCAVRFRGGNLGEQEGLRDSTQREERGRSRQLTSLGYLVTTFRNFEILTLTFKTPAFKAQKMGLLGASDVREGTARIYLVPGIHTSITSGETPWHFKTQDVIRYIPGTGAAVLYVIRTFGPRRGHGRKHFGL